LKIEKISDNQIRCTLDRDDLDEMDIKFSELAYGTEKAKALFRDMVEQAHEEFGFEVDNAPLMVEAIPMGDSQLVLVITRVDDPDELDSRYSRFSKKPETEEDDLTEDAEDDIDEIRIEGTLPLNGGQEAADNLFGMIKNMIENKISAMGKEQAEGQKIRRPNPAEQAPEDPSEMVDTEEGSFVIFAFSSLEDVMKVAEMISDFYDSTNTLYKNKRDKRFYLHITSNRNSQTEFVKVCNVMSEYGILCRTSYSTPDYFDEHFSVILRDDAVQVLAEL